VRVSFRVAGLPAPKGSRIPGRRKDGTIYTRPANASEKSWTEAVAYVARAKRPGGKMLKPPYAVELEFHLPRPKQPKYEWPVRADLDKLERAVLDGLTQGGLIVDDRHVVELRSRKSFVLHGATTGVSISVT